MNAAAAPAAGTTPVPDRVRQVIADQLGLEVARITDPASLRLDLGADSLDEIELVMALEEAFGISITSEEASCWNVVLDVVGTVERLVERKTS